MFRLFLFLNFLIFLLRLFYIEISPFDLSPEEAQYWDWSRQLDLSYYSKPPLVAYLNWISTHIFGNTEFAVRGWSALFGFLSSLLIFRISEYYTDKKRAFLLGLLPNLFVGFNGLSFLFTTDTPLFFFWGLSFLTLLLAVEKEKTIYWTFLGIFGGLGFLSKYSMVLFFPLGVFYIIIRKPYLFRTFKPYLSMFIGFLFTLPVLYWNYLYHWVSFKHVLGLSGLEKHLNQFPNWKTFTNFLISQIALLSFGFFFYLLWGWLKNLTPKRAFFSLTLFSLPIYLVFQMLALKKSVYGNWAGFGYFTGGILAGIYFLRYFKKLLPVNVLFIILALFLNAIAFYPPILDRVGLNKVIPPEKDPTRIMVGWRELGEFVSKFYNPKTDFIFSTRYQICAEMAFYVKGNPRTYLFSYYRRMNQYDLWELKDRKLFFKWLVGENAPYREVFNWEPLIGKNGIFVTPFPHPPEKVLKSFDKLVWTKKYDIVWRGKVIYTYYIHYLKGFKGNYEPIINGF